VHSRNVRLPTLGFRRWGVIWVLSSGKVKTSSWRYYTSSVACRATDYYLGIGEAPGRWAGQGLPVLGLEPGSRVTEQQLEALFGRALHPTTGERLGRAWRTDGVTGFDLTFSAPKSVSALWALGNEQVTTAALAAHQQAVTAGLAYLQSHASFSRRGTNGVEQIATAGLAAALFDHRTSREGDPQLHTHALVVNKALCADGVWRTLDGREMFDHKKTAGIIYQKWGLHLGAVSPENVQDLTSRQGKPDSSSSRLGGSIRARTGGGGAGRVRPALRSSL
jgi:conjugative relaxase-like TrwC/TraI family protein